ncbi:acetylhydrolase [Niastella koreensis]|uniref:Lipolytic protein G-D-S-L family n=2 Tax=Niastella koreensis TaxID=354356 RepID=G8TKW5_NIAKG|nr:lipolytic protein G-D-S-L family [Niastella koreensis GR20-10]OQP51585.1 acetylhydrolase [Niastella koreensis]
MCYKLYIIFPVLFFRCLVSFAQIAQPYTWQNPAASNFPVVEGQAWPAEVASRYDRFPIRAEKTLNPNVWNLSHSSAGLYIKFKTNAANLVVRYVVKGALEMTHMPATGVSGVDLYAIDPNGQWKWAPSSRSFGDTIEYRFSNLVVSSEFPGRDYEYRLYLPLYNTVSWLSIGVPNNHSFNFMPLSPEKPIVVYGTSIAQGACASRPGMAWTALLQQQLDRPLINLGFSGSGRLEQPVIALMNEIDARLYVLDCLPNLTAFSGISAQELENRIIAAVKALKEKRPAVPVLLVEHSVGAQTGIIDTAAQHDYENASVVLRRSFDKMKGDGISGIYLLSNKEIGLSIYSTVDGVHPNDVGMMEYARAYEKIIRHILNEPAGLLSTTIPVVQSRDGYYNWRSRHSEIIVLNKTNAPRIIFFGNSIIHYWGGQPSAPLTRGAGSWNKYLEPAGVRNGAFGWDRIENILWRVYHDELDGFNAAQIWVMAGTNNLTINSDVEIAEGLRQLITAIKVRQPKAAIVLSGILPRRAMEKRIVILNIRIAALARRLHVQYVNPGLALLNRQHKIEESLFGDGLHPNAVGYDKLAVAIQPYLKK